MPLPLEPLVPAPPLVLGELELGDEVEPELELGEALDPLEDEDPPAAPCWRRQVSFSVPVSVSHWVLLAPTDGEVEELSLALGEVALGEVVLGEVVLLLEPPLAAEPVLELPLAPCDDESAAIATAEAANRAANVAVESTFNIVASPFQGSVRRLRCE